MKAFNDYTVILTVYIATFVHKCMHIIIYCQSALGTTVLCMPYYIHTCYKVYRYCNAFINNCLCNVICVLHSYSFDIHSWLAGKIDLSLKCIYTCVNIKHQD